MTKIFSLGADPEFFVEQNGKPKSIIGYILGTKNNPQTIDENNAFKIQQDNVAAEYNIPPALTKEQWVDYILWPQAYISTLLKAHHIKINKAASLSFPPKELLDPKAQEFGCDPDYNAWTLEQNDKPKCNDPTFRTCGGHIHFEMDPDPIEIVKAIRSMDRYLGVWSLLVDKDDNRRKLYGKAGAFRIQPHGGEYRTLSNFWIFDKKLIEEVWDRTQEALNDQYDIPEEEGNTIQRIINTGDKDAARSYCAIHGL